MFKVIIFLPIPTNKKKLFSLKKKYNKSSFIEINLYCYRIRIYGGLNGILILVFSNIVCNINIIILISIIITILINSFFSIGTAYCGGL